MKKHPLFESLAICPARGEAAQYFYGDNGEGYFEGYTHRTAKGSGYWLDGQPYFLDIVPRLGSRRLPHESARQASILPNAIRHARAGLVDDLSILRRRRTLAIRIQSTGAAPAPLGADLLFDVGVGDVRFQPDGDEFLLSFSGAPLHAALACTVPVDLEIAPARNGHPALSLSSLRPARQLLAYLAFDRSPERALQQARSLRDANALDAHNAEIADVLSRSQIETGDPDYDRAVAWAKLTSTFLVVEQFGKGIWAGLPWFKDNWGRDTFIALPGTLLVSGLFDDARDVILNFLRYQDQNPASPTYGRIPNRVTSPTDVIYNTADGTPWLVRELYEYLQHTGDLDLARETYPQIRLALDAAIQREADAEGFLAHDDADTWMDARIMGNLPWSARGNRANDVQALWHNALLVGERLAGYADDPHSAQRWRALADTLRANFAKRFWNPRKRLLADRILPNNRRDEKVRPNQLMVLSIPMIEPLLDDDQADAVVANAVSELLFPHGIASLSPRDPYFHPYHHNDDWHHFDAAYHNGTVWGWNAGFAVTALCLRRQTALASKLARNLARQILDLGCRGSMSELIEAIPRKRNQLVLSGTWAQAWSTAEFVRNAHQDFGGFHPRLLDGSLHLRPHLPDDWSRLDARYPFGNGAHLSLRVRRKDATLRFQFAMHGHPDVLRLRFSTEIDNCRHEFDAPLRPDKKLTLVLQDHQARLSRRAPVASTPLPKITPLQFAKPTLPSPAPLSIRKKNYLQNLIEAGKFR
jgi:glycogen debranching enzyme